VFAHLEALKKIYAVSHMKHTYMHAFWCADKSVVCMQALELIDMVHEVKEAVLLEAESEASGM
jgi:hypothetical protein